MTALAALSLAALPSAAGAKSLGTWKVAGGHLDQTVGWSTVSQSDDGCYTNTWRDHGTTDASFAAIKGQKLTLENRSGYSFIKGNAPVKYNAEVEQDSQYNLKPTRDHPGDQCGPPTQTPPDTTGCGTATHKFGLLFIVGRDDAEPWSALDKPSWFGDACPSDDTLSTFPLNAPSSGSLGQFKRKDEVTLSGDATSDSPQWVKGPGFDQVNNAQHTNITWSLRFKRVN
jgi:hypothetical protein